MHEQQYKNSLVSEGKTAKSKKVSLETIFFYQDQKAKPYFVEMTDWEQIEDDDMKRIELENNTMIDVTQVRDIFEKIMDARISNYKDKLLEI